MNLYRIHFEFAAPPAVIHSIAGSAGLNGYTLLSGEGAWRGLKEQAAVLEVYAGPEVKPAVMATAEALREQLRQEAVLVVEMPVVATMVVAPAAQAAA